MDVYREERQIVLALVVFSAFVLGIISTAILPRQIINTVIAVNQYRYNQTSEVSPVYATWRLKKDEASKDKTAVLGVTSKDQPEGQMLTEPYDLDPWTEECDCLRK